jgi:hypothetical protein
MRAIFAIILSLLVIINVDAGEVTINKQSSLINNQLFDQKRVRAAEYKQLEAERDLRNQNWLEELPTNCFIYAEQYLTYECGNGLFYKGYDINNQIIYQRLNHDQISHLE